MLRSFMSGIAGLKSYQTKMDVIGNNIANVNTIGFKSSNVNFSDVFYQTTQTATSASELNQKAGTNAKQIGYGSSVASIATTVATQGGSQTTNRALDLMINGNAFFIVGMDGQNYFTKNGAFDIDGAGYLSTESGGLVMGWGVDPQTGEIVQDAVQPLQIYSATNQYAEPDATTDVYFQGNIDNNDTSLENGKVIQMDFFDNLGNQYAAKFKIISEGAEDKNEYKVELFDVIDANEKSIFLDATTSNGQTTYRIKRDVSIEFAGYTYKASSVDPITGEVTLDSLNEDGSRTEGSIVTPASISYTPTDGSDTDWLYRQNGNGFEKIAQSEIGNYVQVNEGNGTLSVADTVDELKECAYVLNADGTFTPVTKNNIETTYGYDKIKDTDELPYMFNTATRQYVQMTNADWTVLRNQINNGTVLAADAGIYHLDDYGNYQKIVGNNETYGRGITGLDPTLIKGEALNVGQGFVNKGADIIFNASTGKFASVSGATSRYDENGKLITTNVTFKVNTSDSQVPTSAKNLFEEITIDFSSLSMYADGGQSTVTGVKGQLGTSGVGAGYASGVLTGVSVSNDGKIYGNYDNGVQKVLGQIAVTTFANPSGLEAVGNSLFTTTSNSGDFDGVGSDVMAIGLSISSGALESSNVDLSTEFTNMITTQRGFEANSKTITTSDSMLETLINLKR